jgi:hypothetical protein
MLERPFNGRSRVAVYQTSNLQIIDAGEATQGLHYTILLHFLTALSKLFGYYCCDIKHRMLASPINEHAKL